MAQELDIFEDTAANTLFADSTMAAEQEQSTSDCPEGSVYNEKLDSCIDPNLNLGSFNQSSVNGIDLSALIDNKPDTVIEGEDGNMYRTNPFLTPSGWQTEPDYDTPVYFFHQPLELGDPREIYYTLSEDGSLESQFGTWRTEEEIRGYWDADEGMGYFKEANPDLDFDTWFSFIQEASALSASGLNRNDNPDEFDALVSQYGINQFFQNPDGDMFEFNGSSFTKTYKVDDSIPVGDMIMSVAIGAMTAGVLGPAFGGGFTGGATSGAVGSTISQGVINGKIDPTAVVTAGVLGGIGGYFDELKAATPGAYGGWVDAAGNQIGANSQWMIEKIQGLSNLLGIPFNDAAGIVEGVLNGTVKGEDLEGIAINAVGGWSQAKIEGFLTNTFGDGANVENWFREGDSFIPTEALFPFVETAIQGAIDGGVSKVDLLKMLGGYFKAGGDLDFILPQLPDLGLDFDSDFCEQNPGFPFCSGDLNLTCPKWMRNAQGECRVDVDCPEWLQDEEGRCLDLPDFDIELCSDAEIEQGGETIRIGTPDSWYCKTPETTSIDVELCSDEELAQGGHTVRIGTPDSWYCKVPKVNVGCDSTPVPNGQQLYKKNSIGECIPDVIECIEGFDLVGQECVKISGGSPDICSQPRPEEYGFGQINWDKYCKAPEINCDEGQEYNTELRKCVDIEVPDTTCPDGFRNEDGECLKIDLPSVDVKPPSVSLGQPSQSMFSEMAVKGFSNKEIEPTPLVQTQSFDAMAGITSFINRKLSERPVDQDISDAFNSGPDKGLFT